MLYGVIGCGPAGVLTILELLQKGVSSTNILVVDPYFDGGALFRKWSAIQSNTRWEQVRDVLCQYESAKAPLEYLNNKYSSDQTVLLADLGWLMQESLKPYMDSLQTKMDICNEIKSLEKGFELTLMKEKVYVDVVFLCQGATQKIFDCGKPTIPLEAALNPVELARYVKPNDMISVFGLAHSGTLVIKHLVDLHANIIGFYKTKDPFLFARDGHYDGIKQESATIADKILANEYPNIQLISLNDIKNLIKYVSKSKWIISCIGFQSSPILILDREGKRIDSLNYNPETGTIVESLYGFGIAYPGVSIIDSVCFKDISIPSFQQQIQRVLSILFQKNQS